jgi:lipopolysaccharide export system protein LptA
VDFSRDVMASFYLPPGGGIPQVQGAADTWKLVAEKLTLHVDPSQDPSKTRASARRLIPWAVASGKVLFSSGNYQATAERAIYEDPWSRITLIGTPARVSKDNKTLLESPEIEVRKSGSQIDCSPLGRQSRPSVPVAPAN